MSYYRSSVITTSFAIIILCLTFTSSTTFSIRNKVSLNKNNTSLSEQLRLSGQALKLRNITKSVHDQFKPSYNGYEDDEHHQDELDEEHHWEESNLKQERSRQTANVVVLTSLSGIYVWWPALFGGDDSFHLLLSQEDVPRFHDVTGDEHGHIYLTAPHERTVYRLQYSDGWWVSNFSNHSVMNSIRNEMPLFLTLHHVSSILYVYGHSDIQTIDLFERSGARGSAPFMKRLRELSPNLRISDLIIDQLTSDGYVIGDSYGWCTVIRCSLAASECTFLFKIPSSYDNRPYPCTATIDFSNKIMYLSLEEKIMGVHLNEQTNFDRRFILTEKRGPRSTLGYDDIITHNQTILYTDVLRPLLHICRSTNSNPCINMSLVFSPPQRTILPLRLSVIQAPNFRPPAFDEEENYNGQVDLSDSKVAPAGLSLGNKTSTVSGLVADETAANDQQASKATITYVWMLVLGIVIGLLISALSFGIFYVTRIRSPTRMNGIYPSKGSSKKKIVNSQKPISPIDRRIGSQSTTSGKFSSSPESDLSSTNLLDCNGSSTITSSTVHTSTTFSSSYQPNIVL